MKHATSDIRQIPDKVYFRIGEVSDLVGVDPHVLRYWETEFATVRPYRGKSKQRLYRRQDVENLLLIKTLLHDEGYTISGARKLLKSMRRHEQLELPLMSGPGRPEAEDNLLEHIKFELQAILGRLGRQRFGHDK